MTPYRIQEADLLIPSEWSDKSLNIFNIPRNNDAGEASFLITRDTHDKNKSFEDYLSLQLQQSKAQLPEFQLKKNERFNFQETQCGWFEYTWSNGTSVLYIRQVFYALGTKILVSTLTTTPKDVDYHDANWRKVMSSLKLLPLP